MESMKKKHLGWIGDVSEFLEAHSQILPSSPEVATNVEGRAFRQKCIKDDAAYLQDAIAREDLADIAKGCVESIQFIIGAALAYGIDLQPAWEANHLNNMALPDATDPESGRIVVPEKHSEVDFQAIIDNQKDR